MRAAASRAQLEHGAHGVALSAAGVRAMHDCGSEQYDEILRKCQSMLRLLLSSPSLPLASFAAVGEVEVSSLLMECYEAVSLHVYF